MALDAIRLDTLNWDQIVSAIRTRIPANSQGKWTLHAPVDPGVTLLELFAWLLDQRIYWMDQIPDSLTRATLRLLGQEPTPAKSAVTVIQFRDEERAAGTFSVASKGTVLRRGNVNPPLLFSLDEDVTVLPIVRAAGDTGVDLPTSVRVNGVDRSCDLKHGRPIILLPSSAKTASIEILLNLAENIPAKAAGGQLTFLFELDNPGEIAAEWIADASVVISPPATLNWSYPNGTSGQTASFAAAKIKDGTVGLRRSGIVRLSVPPDWQPEPSTAPGQPPIYKIILNISGANFTAPPRLTTIAPNVGLAHHNWNQTKQAATKDWMPLPGNVIVPGLMAGTLTLKEAPLLEDSVKLKTFERDRQWHTDWTRVTDFAFSGPSDRVFVVDRQRGEIRFGDGLTGRLPVLAHAGDSEIQITYSAGGGPDGNVGAFLDWEAVQINPAGPQPTLTGTNLVDGDGGAESETLAAAQQRVEGLLRERNRAVTGTDYELIAQTTPGVGFRRAHVQPGFHPRFPCQTVQGAVSVFVVPYAPREEIDGTFDPELFVPAPEPDAGALAAARDRMNQCRLIGTQVFVLPPAYRSVWLEVDVAADAPLSSEMREAVALRLRKFLDPLVGGAEGDGWVFGDPIRPTALVNQAQLVLGDSADVEGVSVLLSGMGAAENCLDVPLRPQELPKLEQVQVHIQTRVVTAGGLR